MDRRYKPLGHPDAFEKDPDGIYGYAMSTYAQLTWIELKLDLILEHLGIAERIEEVSEAPPSTPAPLDLKDARVRERAIVQLLHESPGLSITESWEALGGWDAGISRESVGNTMRALWQAGTLDREGPARRGYAFHYSVATVPLSGEIAELDKQFPAAQPSDL